MDSRTMRRHVFSRSRTLRAACASTLVMGALAACGGGSSTGGAPFTPAPLACASAALASADGYSLGVCASTGTGVFLDVASAVSISAPADGYILTLVFPSALGSLDGSTPFTSANLAPPSYGRSALGALYGSAYENPLNAVLAAPFAALTDFHDSCCYERNPPWPPARLAYARFGNWERVPDSAEGFAGVWYAPGSAAVVNHWPLGSVNRVYRGYLAGTVAPDEDGGSLLDGSRGFSAPIEIVVDGTGRISSGRIGTLTISYYTPTATLAFEDLPVDPIDLVQGSADTSPGPLTGALASAGGIGADADSASSRFEARYFGVAGDHGAELAGRLRLRTSNGLIAVASFGARLVP